MLAEYAIQNVKGSKESFDNAASNKILEYKDANLFRMENTSEVSEIFTSTEGMTGAKELGELETPPTLTLEDGYSVTITEKRFGGSINLSEAEYKRYDGDQSVKVAQFLERKRNQLLLTVTNLFLTEAHKFYNEAFSSTSEFLAPDGVEICGTHSWKSGGTFDNGVTAVFAETAVDDALEYAGAFTDPSGKPMPLNFDTIVVKKHSAAHREAVKLFASGINPTSVSDVNIYEGAMKIIATPYINPDNKYYWFLLDSSLENPLYVGIGQMPQMNEPILEKNMSIYSAVTGFWKQGVVNMPFAIYGSNGTV